MNPMTVETCVKSRAAQAQLHWIEDSSLFRRNLQAHNSRNPALTVCHFLGNWRAADSSRNVRVFSSAHGLSSVYLTQIAMPFSPHRTPVLAQKYCYEVGIAENSITKLLVREFDQSAQLAPCPSQLRNLRQKPFGLHSNSMLEAFYSKRSIGRSFTGMPSHAYVRTSSTERTHDPAQPSLQL